MAVIQAVQKAFCRYGGCHRQLRTGEDVVCSRLFRGDNTGCRAPIQLGYHALRTQFSSPISRSDPVSQSSLSSVLGSHSKVSLLSRSWIVSLSLDSASLPLKPSPPLGIASMGRGQPFHTSPRRHIPPLLWLFIKPLAKVGAIIGGRQTRNWWRKLSDEERKAYYGQLQRRWYIVAVLAAGLGGYGVWYYQSHLEDTPITGRRRFVAFTRDQFIKIVEVEAATVLKENEDNLLNENDLKFKRVLRVANHLVSSNQDLTQMDIRQWKISVIVNPSINAFVMPTGNIFVNTGLLEFVDNDDQLAIVLGHEMAHALLCHAIDQVSYAQWIDFFIIVAMGAIWLILPTDGIAFVTQWFYHKVIELLLHMPYSRQLEKEADRVGLDLAAKACFDVREGAAFWTKMHLQEKLESPDAKVPEWLSTHPSNDTRVDFINFLLPKALSVREKCQCPNLPAMDPRHRSSLLSALVDDHIAAKKSGQNLQKLTTYDKPS